MADNPETATTTATDDAQLYELLKDKNLETQFQAIKDYGILTKANFRGLSESDADEIAVELKFSKVDQRKFRNLVKEINFIAATAAPASPGAVPIDAKVTVTPEEMIRVQMISEHFKFLDNSFRSIEDARASAQLQFNTTKTSIIQKVDGLQKQLETAKNKALGILEQQYIEQEKLLDEKKAEVDAAKIRAKEAEGKCNQLLQQPIQSSEIPPRKTEIFAITDKIFQDKIPSISKQAVIGAKIKIEIPQIDVQFLLCEGTITKFSSSISGKPKLFKSLNAELNFIRKFGKMGDAEGDFNKPWNVGCSLKDGNIIVCDYGNQRIEVFDSKGKLLKKFGSKGSGDGQFEEVSGVAVDNDGNIYVCDFSDKNQRIEVFDVNGRFLKHFGKSGDLKNPNCIVVGNDGTIVVSDVGNNQICVFDSKGKLLRKFGQQGTGDGQFTGPFGVGIDSNNNIAVCDRRNHRIQVFDSQGNFIRKFGQQGTGEGQFQNPFAIVIDQDDNIIVTDQLNHRIQIFDSEGNFLRKFGQHGGGDGQFNCPLGVTIDSDGNIVVCDCNNHRIQVIGQL